MVVRLALCFVYGALFALVACGDGATSKASPDGGADGVVNAAVDAAVACPEPTTKPRGEKHRLIVRGKLTPEGEKGVPFFTQNISRVYVPTADIAGAGVAWLTAAGGEQLANAKIIEAGGGITVKDDLTFEIETSAAFVDGPYELGVVISASGKPLDGGPQAGDLASFSLDPAPPCDPKITGTSVRFVIDGKDTILPLDNTHFIRF